jgi:phage baseplate assembly protein W
MTTLANITSVHWQPTLNSYEFVEGEADIEQAIHIILGTPKGSVAHRPDFGSNLHLYIDYPTDQAIAHVVREAVEAIRQWEPRCELVKVIPSIEGSQMYLRVIWMLADGVERETKRLVRQ